MKHRPFLLAAAGLAATSLSASAAVVLSDSFDRTSGSTGANGASWGANDNALGGSATQTYSMDTSRGGAAQNTVEGNIAVFRNGAAQITTDLSTLAPNGYTVAFDFTRRPVNGFIAVGVGLDPSIIPSTGGFNGNAFLFSTNADSDAGVLFQQDNDSPGNGRVSTFGAATQLDNVGEAFTTNDQTHSALVRIDAPSGYGNGAPGTLSVSVDGNSVSSESFTFDGSNSGYLALYSNQTGSQIDNLVVTAVPEPSGVALAGLGVFALLLRRRRG